MLKQSNRIVHFFSTLTLCATWPLCVPAATSEGVVSASANSGIAQQDVRHQLMRQEYFASVNSAGLQAPNRAQGMRIYFDRDGVRIVNRDPQEAQLLHWQLRALRRGEKVRWLEPGVLNSDEARVHIEQRALTQSFDNQSDGLHQSIRIDAAPRGRGKLQLEVDLGSDKVTGQVGEAGLRIVNRQGAGVRVGHLSAVDANGRTLAVSSRLSSTNTFSLTISDAQALYPITVKTVISRVADFRAQSNQVSALFATSVAVIGDINVDGIGDFAVGAPRWDGGESDEGAVFIYYGSNGFAGFGDLIPDKRLEINQANARLGTSVAAAGDVNRDNLADVIAGAPQFDNGASNEGAAFVFSGFDIIVNPTVLPMAQLEGERPSAAMGTSVAGAGDVNLDGYADVIVGAPKYQLNAIVGGRAQVFFGGSPGFDTTADRTYVSEIADELFGQSVAGVGDTNGDGRTEVMIGAPGFANAYLGDIKFDGDVMFSALQSEFGASVAGAGDVNGDGFADILIGAPRFTNGQTDEGAAFLFFGAAGPFNMTVDAILDANQTGSRFASSISGAADINGDGYADFAIGAPNFDQGESNEGKAFVWYGRAGAVSPAARAEFDSNQVNAVFGTSLALGDIDGDGYADVLSGAPAYDFGHSDEGVLFAYFGGGELLSSAHAAQLSSGQTGDSLGVTVDGAGDVNGDGFSDVIVGAPNFDGGEVNEGRALIYTGSASGLNAVPFRILQENQASAAFGQSVSAAGDVNNDGLGDVLVGAPGFDAGQTDEGTAFLYLGGSNVAAARFESNQVGAAMGRSVAGAGDVNGDGYADVIVGAPQAEVAGVGNEVGRALIYFGSSGQIDTSPDALLSGTQAQQAFGSSVASAGDGNGDGFADVIVGAPNTDVTDTGTTIADSGEAYVYFGGAGTFNTQTDGRFRGVSANARAGFSVAGAGDVNGDGFDDVVVGAPFALNFAGDVSGTATVYFGAPNVPYDSGDHLANFAIPNALTGWSVDSAGDVNRDGYGDVLVGASGFDSGVSTDTGVSLLYYGNASGDLAPLQYLSFNQAGGKFGTAVGAAGDINGDGFADVIVGAPFEGSAQPGLVRVFFGGLQPGRTVLPEQTSDGSAAIQAWGTSSALTEFTVSMQAISPRGRERVKLEIQACPPGVDFYESGCRSHLSPNWVDTGANANGVLLLGTIDSLPLQTLYHWRARVKYAPFTENLVSISGIARWWGPWFYLQAQSDAGDVRTGSPAGDTIFANGFE